MNRQDLSLQQIYTSTSLMNTIGDAEFFDISKRTLLTEGYYNNSITTASRLRAEGPASGPLASPSGPKTGWATG